MLSWVESDTYPALLSRQRNAALSAVVEQSEGKGDGGHSAEEFAADGLDEQFGRKRARRIREDRLVYEDGQWYDFSLWRAMYHTVKRRFWVATVIEAGGCESFLHLSSSLASFSGYRILPWSSS